VTDAIREFIRRGIRVETVINRMSFDGTTTDPMKQAVRDALIGFMAAMAQAQAEVIKEAQKAGIAHAIEHDDGSKYRGRKPSRLFAILSLSGEKWSALIGLQNVLGGPLHKTVKSSGEIDMPKQAFAELPITDLLGRVTTKLENLLGRN
jgi:hypothetical protein